MILNLLSCQGITSRQIYLRTNIDPRRDGYHEPWTSEEALDCIHKTSRFCLQALLCGVWLSCNWRGWHWRGVRGRPLPIVGPLLAHCWPIIGRVHCGPMVVNKYPGHQWRGRTQQVAWTAHLVCCSYNKSIMSHLVTQKANSGRQDWDPGGFTPSTLTRVVLVGKYVT